MQVENISPIDGRYSSKTSDLKPYFSEYAFNKYRLMVEIEYLIFLSRYDLFEIDEDMILFLKSLFFKFNVTECLKIKQIESKINHDVKAIEYYIRQKIMDKYGDKNIIKYVHFALTSQDINSTANILMIRDSIETVILPNINDLLININEFSIKYKQVPFLARTHGQPASPTTIGKELLVFVNRLNIQLNILENIKYSTKFGGANGNFNAHNFALPNIDWINFADDFIKEFDLKRNLYTTQIDNYDNYSEIFDCLKRINVILIDFCQDMWLYISRNIIIQKINKEEVGSSTMPFKINPINFENAEGNLLIANSLLEFFSRKLPISRLQRDLTDSTILRNVGSCFSHILIGISSLIEGVNKIDINSDAISQELKNNYVVITEAIQTRMKVLGISESYEKIKEITRNYESSENIKEKIDVFIDELNIEESEKIYLKSISPEYYIGIF